mgnify:CR=1 FL=1
MDEITQLCIKPDLKVLRRYIHLKSVFKTDLNQFSMLNNG